MNYLVTGGTGFIGSSLVAGLRADGHDCTVLSRQHKADEYGLHYIRNFDEIPGDAAFDGVVNLAGESLAGKRWTRSYLRTIEESRLATTTDLVVLCRRLQRPPPVLVSGSAVGYYGHQGDVELDETAPVVPGYAHDLCRRWEDRAREAKQAGVRVCLARIGVVLDAGGGALAQMSLPYRFGIASWMGGGGQWLSWVHREDVVRAIRLLLEREDLAGPFNLTAPQPVTAREFSERLRRHFRTLPAMPMPAPVARLLLGKMADELLLNGQRVVPRALQQAGFQFQYPDVESALAASL